MDDEVEQPQGVEQSLSDIQGSVPEDQGEQITNTATTDEPNEEVYDKGEGEGEGEGEGVDIENEGEIEGDVEGEGEAEGEAYMEGEGEGEADTDDQLILPSSSTSEEPGMYVSNPTLTKDTIGSFISYSVQGKDIPNVIIRRFRDFDTLRNKLKLRWPGIMFPKIPQKKTIGNKEKGVVDLRMEMINHFCNRITSLPEIFTAEECRLFIRNDNEAMKELDKLGAHNYEDLFEKYLKAYPDYDENLTEEECKDQNTSFYQSLKLFLPVLNTFQDKIIKARENFNDARRKLLGVINLFGSYETEWLSKLCETNHLILKNDANGKIKTSITQFEFSAQNETTPYDHLFNKVSADILDVEGMIETLEALNRMIEENANMKAKLKDTEDKIEKNRGGKKSIGSLFKFKSIEEDYTVLCEEKEKLDKNISDLSNVIKVCLYVMKTEIKRFKVISLRNYYRELNTLQKEVNKYISVRTQFYDYVLEEQHISDASI